MVCDTELHGGNTEITEEQYLNLCYRPNKRNETTQKGYNDYVRLHIPLPGIKKAYFDCRLFSIPKSGFHQPELNSF